MVDLLQRTLPPAQRGRPAAEHQQRRLVLLGGGHRAHPVGDAGARGQRGDAGHPGHLRPALGGEGRGLLVAGVDQPDALGAAAVVDGEQVPARQREDGVDAAGPQSAGDQVSGAYRAVNRSVDAHGRSIITPMVDTRRAHRRRRPHRPDRRHRTGPPRNRLPDRRPASPIRRSTRKPLVCNHVRSRCSRAWACCAGSSTRPFRCTARSSTSTAKRIAFARILLTKPRAVFLDESTSALDEGLELTLYELIRS